MTGVIDASITGRSAKLLRTGCYSTLVSWIGYGAFVLGIGGLFVSSPLPEPFISITLAGICIVLLAGIPLAVAAISIRCPHCQGRVLLTSGTNPHRHARRVGIVPGYKILVIDIIRLGRFTCYHCGKPCLVD